MHSAGSVLFDLEYLEKLTYDRSKTWATLLENVVAKETFDEIDINAEDNFGCSCDETENDELASMEDNESDNSTIDSEVLRNISIASRISLINKSLSPKENGKNENQLIDIFNQTLPIINEHNRQLKETGFDKILSSFDRKVIEDKVGSWLNRHNSLFGGNNPSQLFNDENNGFKNIELTPCTSCRYQNRITRKTINDSDDDSLQSGETARYIRSSKVGAIKNSASTTTIIKTFRKVRSTQETLSERFGLRHFRKIPKDMNCYELARLRSPSKYKMRRQSSSQKPRTKVFRKRTCSNSYSIMDSSSDSDCYNEFPRFHRKKFKSCWSKHHCSPVNFNTPLNPAATVVLRTRRCATDLISTRRNRMLYCLHSKMNSSSTLSSSNSFDSMCGTRGRLMKKNSKFFNDKRLCKRESECNCSGKRKLCEKYKHVADTSTDEWYVENSSPKKVYVSPKTENHLKLINEKPHKSQIKNEKTILKEYSDKDKSLTDDWNRELQKAIKESKKLFEKEQNNKLNKSNNERIKALTKSSRKQVIKHINQNDEIIEKISTLSEEKSNEVDILNLLDDASLPTQNKANILTNTAEETFFTSTKSRAICNSTALSHSSRAYNRQITDSQQNENKSMNGTLTDVQNSKKRNAKQKDLIMNAEKKYTSPTISDDKGQNVAAIYAVTSTNVRFSEIDSTNSEIKIRKTNNEANGRDPNETTVKENTTDDDDWELQMAIDESKKMFEKEQNNKLNKRKKGNNQRLATRALRKSSKKQVIKRTKQNNETIKNISSLSEEKSNEVDIISLVDDSPLPTENNANILTNTAEEAFCTSPQTRAMRKSTALSHSSRDCSIRIAYNQQNEKSKNGAETDKKKPLIKNGKWNAKQKDLIMNVQKKYSLPTISDDKGQNVAAVYTVTSTTVRFPETDSTNNEIKIEKTNNEINGSDHNDCAQVTSTTNVELTLPKTITEKVYMQPLTPSSNSSCHLTRKKYLIYTPDNQNNPSAQSFSNDGYFTISKEHLSRVIGEKSAKKFLKYYVGRKRFKNNSNVYYRPPAAGMLCDNDKSTTSSSADELDNMGQYGDLYESVRKPF